ncbi:pilus (MSHA type) biogenesis protein MshL [Desulforhopalus vacuolatus]|uniref:pilus (MSHA type) biogenesis protein MshL n=1 Tax=Desulforhopalus vacuolatus TaxID=40414 RepID=UPI001964E3D9|nr:pilus (MSHA type) biogenesis protein MshL [Desulforhopalus vacuolatus]
MKSMKKTFTVGGVLVAALLLSSCVSSTGTKKTDEKKAMTPPPASKAAPASLPVRYQTASYVVDQAMDRSENLDDETVLKVGARITTTSGPLPLWDIVKRLVALKGMSVSWASDVDKNVLVDVDINPEDDFYKALDDMLRQVDYFGEVQGNTIVIKFRDTKRFQIAMPFVKQQYATQVGGNLLGSSGSDGKSSNQINGTVSLNSSDNQFDVWANIEKNLDTILDVWELKNVQQEAKNTTTTQAQSQKQGEQKEKEVTAKVTKDKVKNNESQGYYVIDKPVGLITVTAPRPVLEKVDAYISNLKRTLYKQISIEAKIIEVQIDNESNYGINWSSVLKNFSVSGTLTFGADGQVYPYIRDNSTSTSDGRVYTDRSGSTTDSDGVAYTVSTGTGYYDAIDPGQFISKIALGAASFDVFLNALKEEGQTKILSNPKISVMNGQPAMITVGTNYTYIKEVTVTVDSDTDTNEYSVDTDRLLAGVALSLTATILDDHDIIMNLTPITSELVGGEITEEYIGTEGQVVGLPVINIREMSTTVRVGDGEMLVIGGLISDSKSTEGEFLPILGDIPVIRYLFGYETKKRTKRELIILLRPKII